MAKVEIGAQLYTVREHTQNLDGVKRSLEKVAKIGYRAVQLSGIGGAGPKEIARMTEDNGLQIVSTHTDWDRFRGDIDSVIEEHLLWKCRHPAIGGLPEDYRSLDGLKRFIDELTPIAEKLAKEGMDFSYHNHSHELARYGEKTWLQQLYELAPPDILKAEIDTYWIQHGGGDPAAWIESTAGRSPLLHLKDMCITSSREQRYAEVGEGNLNWDAIIREARNAGVDWYLVEQDDCYGRDPFESLAISFRNMRAMGLN